MLNTLSRRVSGPAGLSRFAGSIVLALAAAALGQSLDGRVEQILRDPRLGDSKTGVVIMDLESGSILASKRVDEALIPASNMKVLTSGAALTILGPGFSFSTDLLVDPAFAGTSPAGKPISGRVVLRGSGDPTLGDPVLLEQSKRGVESIIQGWVTAMKEAGVAAGTELVVDDRVFDREYVHPSWPVEQLNRWYCAEVCGVNFHTNLLRIFTTPQAAGTPPVLKLEPAAPWLDIRNRARSVGKGSQTAWAQREEGNRFTVHGDVRYSTDPVEVAMSDVPGFMVRLLADRMTAAGMAPASARLASADEDLSGGRVVHSIKTDLAAVLRRCNVDSYNLYAESMLKRMGHEVTQAPGSFANGAAVVRMVLAEKLGPEAGQAITVADGSGMSRQNKVSPRILAQWLRTLHTDDRLREPFLASLPRASEEGTLRRRFQGKPLVNDVRAKTGFLSGVIAMSGYVRDPSSGKGVVFSIITNDKPNKVQTTTVREMEERIVRLADEWVSDRRPGAARPSAGAR